MQIVGNPENEDENWTYLNQEEIVYLMRKEGSDVSRRVVRQSLKKHKSNPKEPTIKEPIDHLIDDDF